MKSRNVTVSLLGLATLIATSHATVLTLDPLTNPGFEAPSYDDGAEHSGLQDWANSARGNTMRSDLANPSTYVSTGASATDNQVAMFWGNGSNNSTQWFYQNLRGTSDINGVSHDLTAGEAAGQAFDLSARIGIQSIANGWQSQHTLVELGLQDSSNVWLDSQTVYTGTEAQATTAGLTADVYLGLDGDSPTGASEVWTYNANISGTPPSGESEVRYAVNIFYTSGNQRGVFDDMGVSLVPEPGSAALLMLGLASFATRRRR